MLLENAEIAARESIPICQDTGLVTVYVQAGQEVHFTGGSLQKAIQQGVAESYTQNYLRASAVKDPLFDRSNTKDNTPALVYCDITEGDAVKIEITAKGFGSENMSRLAMLKPAEGLEGVKKFVIETIRLAGPNACPPMIVGVGVGGTFDYSAYLAKRALLRPISEGNPDPQYRALEEELAEKANALGIGPMGLHGRTTVLKISILSAPTHIAGLPCAVNICCHACRHREIVL
jgi:fumarate hydratase subunit alpha